MTPALRSYNMVLKDTPIRYVRKHPGCFIGDHRWREFEPEHHVGRNFQYLSTVHYVFNDMTPTFFIRRSFSLTKGGLDRSGLIDDALRFATQVEIVRIRGVFAV